MQKIVRAIFVSGIGLFAIFFSLQSLAPSKSVVNAIKLPKFVSTPLDSIITAPTTDISDQPFQDNLNIYQDDVPGSVVTVYITVRKGNSADNTDHTWKQVNDFSEGLISNDALVQEEKAEAIVQFGDDNGPIPGELGYDEVVPNATVRARGPLTHPQLSYTIAINQGAGKWRGQSTIALDKHFLDPSRLRNKLNFDLMKQIPDLISLRTQFIHLYIMDQTTDPESKAFVDYGLFTQVEVPDKKFLKSRFLDPNGQLYKAALFDFGRYPDQIRLVDDPLFDESLFSTRLEIKGNKDNSKLIQMRDDVNNPDIPIEATFEKYFNADNYFAWMAYNILVDNVSTSSTNFYLYSPHNSNKFYFIPWDYDDSFFRQNRVNCCDYSPYASYEYGVANYWGSHLANRLLRISAYRQALDSKINELMEFLTPQKIAAMLADYKPVVEKYSFQMPDAMYLPNNKVEFEQDLKIIPTEVKNNYTLYLESVKTSMPFYLGVPTVANGILNFKWGESYDFNGQAVSYHFIVARDPALNDVMVDKTLPNATSTQVGLLTPGEYFWGVTAINESGKIQFPYDTFLDSNNMSHPGVKGFYITSEGELLEK